MVERRTHNPKVNGSSPFPASQIEKCTMIYYYEHPLSGKLCEVEIKEGQTSFLIEGNNREAYPSAQCKFFLTMDGLKHKLFSSKDEYEKYLDRRKKDVIIRRTFFYHESKVDFQTFLNTLKDDDFNIIFKMVESFIKDN